MNPDRDTLVAAFHALADDELIRRVESGTLTELAQSVAQSELRSRGLSAHQPSATAPVESSEPYHGDLVIVAKRLMPTEAHLLSSCLQAAGIPAETGDTHFVQAYSLLAIAVGGASVRVPAAFAAEAREVIAAYQRGEFRLDEDFDTEDPAA
ncbi:MAG: DUF2007 domain-containing protein [Burkholderiales bacterium]|nr:DUF2007 domain-containing protein [Burkholderiales bacterium]